MTNVSRIHQAGEYLAAEYLARRPLNIMVQGFAPTSESDAYGAQEIFLGGVAESTGTAIWGYKIAYTNTLIRELTGIDSPCSGLILADRVHHSPAELQPADYVQVGIECEVAVRLGSDLPASGAPYTRASVTEAIEWLATSFELIDRRDAADADGTDPSIKAILINISNGGAVLGKPVTDWSGIDLAASRGRMIVNGEVVGEGPGSDVMGHPIEPLAWLANSLAAAGGDLPAGTTILTGSFAPPVMLARGDRATASIDGLGDARLVVGD